jgi:hypothetical protein
MQSRLSLHLVFGGELASVEEVAFADPAKFDLVGLYPNFEAARAAWAGKAQQTVDQATVRYFVVPVVVGT